MNRKAFRIIIFGLVAFGTTSANADDVKQWVQENGQNATVGVVAGGLTATASLQTGNRVAKAFRGVKNDLIQHAEEKENSTFLKAAEPYIQKRDKITEIMAPFIKAQEEDKARLEAICKNQECKSGVAYGLDRGIKNRQSVLKQFESRREEYQAKIDDMHKYLASGGKAKTDLSSAERYKLDSLIEDYKKDMKTSGLLRKEAENYEKRAQKTIIGSIGGTLLAIPVGVGTTLMTEQLSQRKIASESAKAQAELHVTTVHRAPAAESANAEAK